MPAANSNTSNAASPRRGTIFAAAFLLLALTLVVMFTSRAAFLSPIALVVVAAIGLAALLLQLHFRREMGETVRAPLSLNIAGIVIALAAIGGDSIHLGRNALQALAFGAVACFAVSGVTVFRALRRKANRD